MRIMSDKAITKEEVQSMVDSFDRKVAKAVQLAVINGAISAVAVVIAIIALAR